ncbi:hypothetical protein [Streptomyces guryensis]|uniref:Uncharacterized protein n=1 Tax=Streptomyces guryensis TaxID=2886947 RepID=A0A9Q3VYD1_9ACTN|nr:hypothetical protein [Streptomyces guryensis]MCD9880432.1 hypothetical protein [Streptomyces guryensis]
MRPQPAQQRGAGPHGLRYYVAARKREILVESGKAPLEAFVPQTHQPAHEAEVDDRTTGARPAVGSGGRSKA